MPRKRKAVGPEYYLILSRKKGDSVTVFTLRTVKEFASFQYAMTVESDVHERIIRFNIKGLQTPGISLPRPGPAIFTTEIAHLKGAYEIIIRKSDGEEQRVRMRIKGETLSVEKTGGNRFVELITPS